MLAPRVRFPLLATAATDVEIAPRPPGYEESAAQAAAGLRPERTQREGARPLHTNCMPLLQHVTFRSSSFGWPLRNDLRTMWCACVFTKDKDGLRTLEP